MKKMASLPILFLLFLVSTGCSSFVRDADSRFLTRYEKQNQSDIEYTLLKDVEINKDKLSKGSAVKVIVVADNNWVKVYVYRSSESILKSRRFLVLYLFEDDFPEKKFSRDIFDREFRKVLLEK